MGLFNRVANVGSGMALALGVIAHAAAETPFIQFTLEGPGVARHTATFDVTGWSGAKGVNGVSALQGATSREGRYYSQVSLSIRQDTPYLTLGVFEDGKPTHGSGSNSLAMRTKKAGDDVDSFLKVSPAISESKRATGTFSGVLVVTNRKSKSALDRTYQLTGGRYSFTAKAK
jgi:hypothetical protein